jgi:S-layer protein
MLTGATVELKAAGNVEVKLGTDGTADVVNFVTNATTGTNIGTATADKVETINISATDTDLGKTGILENVSTNSLNLDADAAKTINLTGAGNLTLTLAADTKVVTLIDGSTATGKLTVTTLAGTSAPTTVKGGSADDTLTAAGTNDVLIGGAGKDTLKLGADAVFVKLDGGAGIDTYDISGVSMKQIGDYSQIVNLEKGESIKFDTAATANFYASKFELGGAVTFDSYVTQALAKAAEFAGGAGGVAWFQFASNGTTNTYVVQENAGVGFQTGDNVIEIVGAVDLSASSFNADGQGTLLYI